MGTTRARAYARAPDVRVIDYTRRDAGPSATSLSFQRRL
jgi:hypothetical protein